MPGCSIELRNKRRAAGKCTDCGREPDSGFLRCRTCRVNCATKKKRLFKHWTPEQRRRYRGRKDLQRKRCQLRWREAGLCRYCGSLPLPNRTTCDNCRKRRQEQKARAEQRKKIPCSLCGVTTNPRHELCFSCRCKSRQRSLEALLRDQGSRCIYSDLLLEIGKNAHLDHRVPRSRGGSNTIDNLQWLDARINRMKTDFTHEEFLEMCATVVELWQKKQNQLRIA